MKNTPRIILLHSLAVSLLVLGACSNEPVPNQTSITSSQSMGEGEGDWSETNADSLDSNDPDQGFPDQGDTDDADTDDAGDPDLPPDQGCPPDCDPMMLANLVPVHVLGDPTRRMLYVTVNGDAPEYANEVVVVDPVMGVVVNSFFVGSNPGTLALADDGSTLWVGLDGSHEIARIDLETTPPTVVATHFLPPGDYGDLGVAGPMVVLAGTVDSVAVSLHQWGYSPSFIGLSILDDGVPRPDQTPGHTGASRVTGGPPGWLYGFNNQHTGFEFYAIEALVNGPSQTEHEDYVSGFNTEIVYADGRVYASSGEIVNVSEPSMPVPAGEFAYAGLLIPQLDQQRILMFSPPSFDEPMATLRTLDPMTFTQIDSVALDVGELEFFQDFTTTDGEVLAVIGQGWGFEDDLAQLLLFDNPL